MEGEHTPNNPIKTQQDLDVLLKMNAFLVQRSLSDPLLGIIGRGVPVLLKSTTNCVSRRCAPSEKEGCPFHVQQTYIHDNGGSQQYCVVKLDFFAPIYLNKEVTSTSKKYTVILIRIVSSYLASRLGLIPCLVRDNLMKFGFYSSQFLHMADCLH